MTRRNSLSVSRIAVAFVRRAKKRMRFFSRFSFLPLKGALGGLGETWLTDTMQVKVHAACWYFQTALDAAEELLAEHGGTLRPQDISSIRSPPRPRRYESSS